MLVATCLYKLRSLWKSEQCLLSKIYSWTHQISRTMRSLKRHLRGQKISAHTSPYLISSRCNCRSWWIHRKRLDQMKYLNVSNLKGKSHLSAHNPQVAEQSHLHCLRGVKLYSSLRVETTFINNHSKIWILDATLWLYSAIGKIVTTSDLVYRMNSEGAHFRYVTII